MISGGDMGLSEVMEMEEDDKDGEEDIVSLVFSDSLKGIKFTGWCWWGVQRVEQSYIPQVLKEVVYFCQYVLDSPVQLHPVVVERLGREFFDGHVWRSS